MVSRNVPTSASTPPVTGPSMLDTYAERFGTLFDNISLIPTNITNSGNDYTLTIDPPLTDDVVNGMCFFITPNASNTGAARIRVTSANPYYSWVKSDGSDFSSGEIDITNTYLVVFAGGVFKTLTNVPSAGGGGGGAVDFQEFLTSGIWTKPIDPSYGPNSRVFVQLHGGGGSGAFGSGAQAGGGGGGGACVEVWFLLSDLSATETVTIGAGGAAQTSGSSNGVFGGNTTFGSHATAYGGGGGAITVGVHGGGGGGVLGVGPTLKGFSTGTGGPPDAGAVATVELTGGGHSSFGGGGGGAVDADSPGGFSGYGGGGGGGGGSSAGTGLNFGGNSLKGGGGGGGGADGGTAGAGGTSIEGGNGGAGAAGSDAATAGSVPGGGGGGTENGNSGAGGAGRARVTVFPVAA